jgi:hypothetical protein
VKLRKPSIGGKLSFILSFLFPDRLHCCYTYFHCSYLYNYYNYSRTLCIKCWAFRTELQHFILTFNKNVLTYFADTIEREDRGGERRPKDRVNEDRVTLRIALSCLVFRLLTLVFAQTLNMWNPLHEFLPYYTFKFWNMWTLNGFVYVGQSLRVRAFFKNKEPVTRQQVKSILALWEYVPHMGSTHCKAQGQVYHEPKHT